MANIPDTTTLLMVRAKVTTDGTGAATILLKVPGTIGLVGARKMDGGLGWFNTPHADDTFMISHTDEDNILGYGAGFQIGTYADQDVMMANRGWYIPFHKKYAEIHKMSEVHGDLIGGCYLKVTLQKGDNSVDVFRTNIEWGKDD